jgi:hypothetical protein
LIYLYILFLYKELLIIAATLLIAFIIFTQQLKINLMILNADIAQVKHHDDYNFEFNLIIRTNSYGFSYRRFWDGIISHSAVIMH